MKTLYRFILLIVRYWPLIVAGAAVTFYLAVQARAWRGYAAFGGEYLVVPLILLIAWGWRMVVLDTRELMEEDDDYDN